MQQEQSNLDRWDSGTTRSGFLRRAGKTLAIGLGVALVPAARASAAPLLGAHCCPDSSCGTCPTGYTAYSCYDACANRSCCAGCLKRTGCFDGACGPCQ